MKSQIGAAGVSSVTFDEATGVLTVVDGTGTKTYNVMTGATEAVNIEIKDGHLYVNSEDKGAVGGSVVTVDENGILNIDGEPAGLEVGNKVVIAEVNGTYQLTVDGTTVTLPTATSVGLTAVENYGNAWVAGTNYAWAAATKDIEWDGPMGDVKKGDLLLGGLSTSSVKVSPINYDLGAQELTLIDMYGGKAPVKIVAYEGYQGGVTSRASSPNGVWNLSFSMDETVTSENVATAFTKKVNGVDMNLKYALAVNGVKMTGYDYVIDTQTENESKANVAIDKNKIEVYSTGTGIYNYVGIDGDMLALTGSDANRAVDSYIKFEGLAASQAESMGITAEGMKITAPATAAGKKIENVSVYILDVTGTITKKEVDLQIASTTTTTTETASPVSIKISTDNKFTIDLGEIFKNLDANVVLNAKNAELISNDLNFFALKTTTVGTTAVTNAVAYTADIVFKKSDNTTVELGEDLRTVTKAVVTLNGDGSATPYQTGATNLANIYGAFNLDLNLTDGLGNIIKKVVVPVTVSKPEFSDYYSENPYANWDNGKYNHVITAGQLAIANTIWNINKDSDNQPMTSAYPTYTVSYKNYEGTDVKDVALPDVLTSDNKITEQVASSGTYNLKVTSMTVKAKKTAAKIKAAQYDQQSGTYQPVATASSIDMTKEFTMNLVQQFSGVKVVYFTNNVAGDKAIVVDNLIAGYANAETDPNKPANYNGLAFQYGTTYLQVKANATAADSYKLNGYKLQTVSTAAAAGKANEIKVAVAKDGSSLGDTPTFVDAATNNQVGGITITDLNAGEGGKLNFIFVDNIGIRHTASIEYVKQ